MTMIGTNHFASLTTAFDYYDPMGESEQDVLAAIRRGDINIGKPDTKDGEDVWLNVEGRYIVEKR